LAGQTNEHFKLTGPVYNILPSNCSDQRIVVVVVVAAVRGSRVPMDTYLVSGIQRKHIAVFVDKL